MAQCVPFQKPQRLAAFETFIRTAKTGQRKRIECRNAMERRTVHRMAERAGLLHRTVLDYNKPRVKIHSFVGGKTVFAEPTSYVELGVGEEKLVLYDGVELPWSFELSGYRSGRRQMLDECRELRKERREAEARVAAALSLSDTYFALLVADVRREISSYALQAR